MNIGDIVFFSSVGMSDELVTRPAIVTAVWSVDGDRFYDVHVFTGAGTADLKNVKESDVPMADMVCASR